MNMYGNMSRYNFCVLFIDKIVMSLLENPLKGKKTNFVQ